MKRKMIALLFGATLALGALTACGNTADTGTGTDTTAPSGDTMASPMASDMMMSPEASTSP